MNELLSRVTHVCRFVVLPRFPQMSEIYEAKVKVIGRQQRLKPSSELACFYTLQGMTCVQAFLLVLIAIRFLNTKGLQ